MINAVLLTDAGSKHLALQTNRQFMSSSGQWSGQTVLITGVCGTVGHELLKQLSVMGCERIVGIDNNETELFFLSQTFAAQPHVEVLLCDMRDGDNLKRLFRGVDIVLHAAALKHVILCERSPRDAVATNVVGIMNVIDAAEANQVKRLLFTSSDKAVNPTNVMGTTKLMGERLVTAAHAHGRDGKGTIFASTRFGNILGSRGSVVPLFRRQIQQGLPVTLTDPEMTRFVMTLKEAVSLVIESTFMARGGEVFVTKMPVARIADLASVLIEKLAPVYGRRAEDIELRVVGVKAGEKMYEELMNEEEVRRTVELDRYFAVLPAFKGAYRSISYEYGDVVSDKVTNPYNSSIEPALGRQELAEYLMTHGVLEESACEF
ncbi:SDR family NAD(P)-dependent oxidoreductase [Polaromonas sp.]|uniref:SDR family NAD(P)-dependent oxidoreductase n=1 Tax=Polaromonas sp. TaxID=1869339 RepID=UPI0026002A93|nr:SDR family NAD(P)-dependent oxidoreductase [Polaromonas sp.]